MATDFQATEGHGESRREVVVGLIADPGLPYSFALSLKEALPRALGNDLDGSVDWEVQASEFSLPLNEQGDVEINSHSVQIRESSKWDYLIYLTDLPKYVNGEPLTASVNVGFSSAVIVLPALGIVRKRRLRRAAEQALAALHQVGDPYLGEDGRPPVGMDPFSVERKTEATSEEEDAFDTAKGIRGRMLLLSGMIRSNRPWHLIPRLSSALAAALAAGAFGIFYTSIWSMADYVPTRRLIIISLLAVSIMGSWLILHNRLWEKPRGSRHREKRIMYNLATILTILLAVVMMYVALFAIILAGALIIIDPRFLALQLDQDIGFAEYLNLSWLSASLGIVAGAVGSRFDDEESVRKATFSSREYERRQITLENSFDNEE